MVLKSLIFCLIAFVVLFVMSMIVAALIKLIAAVIQKGTKQAKSDSEAGYSA